MNNEAKNRFDAIFHLCQQAWEQFNERRRFEWKISLIYWTALAFAVAGSVRLETFPLIPGGRFTLIVFALLPFLLHLLWCYGIGRGQRADRMIAIFYERQLQRIVDAEFDWELMTYRDGLRKRKWVLKNWAYVFELGVTAFLAAALALVNWHRFGDVYIE